MGNKWAAVLLLLAVPAWAGGGNPHSSSARAAADAAAAAEATAKASVGDVILKNDIVGSTNSNTTNVGESDSLSLVGVLGDVDIGDCLASKQLNVIIVSHQWVVENALCVARELDAIGAYEAAAEVRCRTKTLSTVYPELEVCIDKIIFRAPQVPVPQVQEIVSSDEDDDYHDEILARIEAIEKQKAKDARAARAAAKRADEAAAAAAKAEQERRDYAQQTYQELSEKWMKK